MRRRFTLFTALFLGFVALSSLWSISTPAYSGPDEPAQVTWAAAVVRGEWIAPRVENPGNHRLTTVSVRVPKAYSGQWIGLCYLQKESIPASCSAPMPSGGKVQTSTTYVGRYPPLYYLLVGWPTLIGSSNLLYLMRFLSGILSAIFMSLALMAVLHSSKMIIAATVAITPQVIYLTSVVNPNGLEITTGLSAAAIGMTLPIGKKASLPRRLSFIISLCLLMFCRPISVLWGLMIVAVIAGIWIIKKQSVRTLLGQFGIIGLSAIGVSAILACTWTVIGSPDKSLTGQYSPQYAEWKKYLVDTVENIPSYFNQTIGLFGWQDSPAPVITVSIWFGILAFLVISLFGGRMNATARCVSLGGLILWVIFPVLSQYKYAEQLGLIWQGRYGLPIFTTSVFVLLYFFEEKFFVYRQMLLIFTALFLGHIAAFYSSVRRFVVGNNGPYINFSTGWRPPLVPAIVLTPMYIIVLFLIFLVLILRIKNRSKWESFV